MSKRAHTQRHSPASTRRRASRSKAVWMWGGLLVIVLIAAAALVFRPQPGAQAPSVSGPAVVSVDQAYASYQQGVFILDVREPQEWDAFHIPETTLIPLGQLEARLDELPRDREIVVVCRTGNRSQQGRDILLAAGFTDVASMAGGVIAWSNAGYPIEGTRP